MKIAVILGTRPEIIKMTPVIKELERQEIEFFVLHTGQHYSENLDSIFFDQLEIPESKYNIGVGSKSPSKQVAEMMLGIEVALSKEKPCKVLVLGDTNSVLAGALVANKMGIKVGHIEAGLRSFDKTMQEEINRILTDNCSDMLFAPTVFAENNLRREGLFDGQVYLTGNTIVDVVKQNLQYIKDAPLLKEKGKYFLATIHRQENIENRHRFYDILKSLIEVARKYETPVVYPIHPHSMSKIKGFIFDPRDLELIEPVDYFSFLRLEQNAKLILTDSGGVQEEACILGVPCVTLRYNTERQETLRLDANILAGTQPNQVLKCVDRMLNKSNQWVNPFGDGHASERIVEILKQ